MFITYHNLSTGKIIFQSPWPRDDYKTVDALLAASHARLTHWSEGGIEGTSEGIAAIGPLPMLVRVTPGKRGDLTPNQATRIFSNLRQRRFACEVR